MPTPPLTRDQVQLLMADNVLRGDRPGLPEQGIAPTSAELIVPTYLSGHSKDVAE